MASGVVHQTEGFFTFALAFALLLAEARLLQLVFGRGRREGPGGPPPSGAPA
jgi:hypothetical protein